MTRLIDMERVFFEIEADPRAVSTKPFADISKLSYFTEESEVLFMLGSVFRLNSINYRNDQVWIIQMSLCSDDEHDLKQVLVHMKNQQGSGDMNLRTLGKLLWKMGKLDLAEKYYVRYLDDLASNNPSFRALYDDLAEITSQKGNYDASMQWHQKSLAMKWRNEPVNMINIGKFLKRKSITTDPVDNEKVF
jgi:tetratricopeptide (TPR) repeat protein